MAFYALHGLQVEIDHAGVELAPFLTDLSFEAVAWMTVPVAFTLTARHNSRSGRVSPQAREVFREEGWIGLVDAEDAFYLTDGVSVLHVEPEQRRGGAELSPTFFENDRLLQQRFWTMGLLKLLQPAGVFALHSAGLEAPTGEGVLIVGPSGSGKSTLAIGLIRRGWRYLGDDALLLRAGRTGVEALSFRRPFSVSAETASRYAGLRLDPEDMRAPGRHKRRVDMDEAYFRQRLAACSPRILLFPGIVRRTQSTLRSLDPSETIGLLLQQSGPQLFHRSTMAAHLAVLKRLVSQAASYRLDAGHDLYEAPERLEGLLASVRSGTPWPASSSN